MKKRKSLTAGLAAAQTSRLITCLKKTPSIFIKYIKMAAMNLTSRFTRHSKKNAMTILETTTGKQDVNFWMTCGERCGKAFIEAYAPIVQKRKHAVYSAAHKHWQEIRRGRYVEFNLIHDRGTLFGLKTNGRIESILMSLPPTVRFEYNSQPQAGSEEDKLLQVCLKPREWA